MEENHDLAIPHNQRGSRIVYLDPVQDEQYRSPGIVELWELLRARQATLATITVLTLLAALVITFVQKPLFRAQATLQVQSPSDAALKFAGHWAEQASSVNNLEMLTQSQLSILNSRMLRSRVDESFAAGGLSWSPEPRRVEVWARDLGIPIPQQPAASEHPPVRVSTRVLPNSHIIEIVCYAPSAALAAEYANRLGSELQQWQVEVRSSAAAHASAWLKQETDRLRKKLGTAEQELQYKSRDSGLQVSPDQQTADQIKLRHLQEELSRATADRIGKQSVHQFSSAGPIDPLPPLMSDQQLSNYKMQLAELGRQLALLNSDLTPEHYKVKRLNAQIAAVQSQMENQAHDVLERVHNDYTAALQHEGLLKRAFNSQKQVVASQTASGMSLDLVKREIDSDRKLYDALLQEAKAVDLQSASITSPLSVVDPAVPPREADTPNMLRNLEKGLGAGLIFGILLVVGSDQLNRSLKAPGDTAVHLRIPELGVILEEGTSQTLRAPSSESPGKKVVAEGADAREHAISQWQNKPARVAESFRNVLASILVSGAKGMRPRVILITSASRGEGKSTLVSNLGMALAEINQRVLLIDADMRQPVLHRLFHVSNSWGLSDLLKEKSLIERLPREALAKETAMRDLYLLPSGPGTASIAALIYSTRMGALLAKVRDEFDVVLIDTPPILCLSDARVLGRLSDAAILVVRAGHTTRDQALLAKQRLCADGINVIGSILNAWKYQANGYGYAYYPGEAADLAS